MARPLAAYNVLAAVASTWDDERQSLWHAWSEGGEGVAGGIAAV